MSRVVVACAILLLAGACGHRQEQGGSGTSESWGVVSLSGKRIGYAHSVRTVRSGEIENFVQSRISLKRMGTEVKINSDLRHVETPEGKALRFSSLTEMSPIPTLREGVIENGKLRIKTTTGGNTSEKEMDWDPDALLTEGIRLRAVKSGFAPGTTYAYKTFNPEYGRFEDVEIEVEGDETRTLLGKELKLHRIRTKMSLQQGIVSKSWVDDEGSDHASEFTMMGLKFVFEPATREEALKEAGAELPEIFFQTMPRSNVALPRPREITALTVRLERPDGGLADWKPPETTQKVLARDAKSVTLRIAPSEPEKAGEDRSPFLKPSPAVQCDDAEIVKKAREIAGDEKDPARLAGRLAGWVHEHIDKKSMDIGAASAKEVFTNRSGDCSEHAVLLAAMFRAAGIPAKVCCGYLYFRGSWGGHAWTNAWIGRWVDFDATLGDQPADAARIKFSETAAEDLGGIMEGMLGAGFMHGGMKIDIGEYTLDGKTMKAAAPVAAEGNRFESPLLGLSFEKPEGWTFRDPKELPPFTLAGMAGPEGKATAVVKYIDLSYDVIPLNIQKAARKLGAPSSGEEGKLGAFETYETDTRLYVRVAPGEMIEVTLKGGDEARPALEQFKKTMKISR